MVAENRVFALEGSSDDAAGVEELLVDPEEGFRNRTVIEYLLFFNPESMEIINDPVQVWEGKMDQVELSTTDKNFRLSISCEGIFSERNHTPNCMLTAVDQKERFPGDEGLSDVALLESGQAVTWPS